MHKIIWTILLSLLLFACRSEKNQFKIDGKISGSDGDTIYIYNMEKDSTDIDTIITDQGKFAFQTEIDTSSYFMLIFPYQKLSLPIRVEKGSKIKVQADSLSYSTLSVTGENFNNELTEFRKSLHGISEQDSLINKAEQYIKANPYSRVSVYLLQHFFVLHEHPDYDKIQELIKSMSGELQDIIIVKRLSERIEKLKDISKGKRAPSFSMKNTAGKTISMSNTAFRSKYILLNFWATWSEESLQTNQMIKKIKKQFNKKNIEFIGVSLDYDKDLWLEQIKKDTLNWEQINDFNGWENSIVKQYGILDIPMYFLINPQRTIIEQNLSEEELTNKLEELLSDSQQTPKNR